MFLVGCYILLFPLVSSLLPRNIIIDANAKKHHKGIHVNVKQTFGNLN